MHNASSCPPRLNVLALFAVAACLALLSVAGKASAQGTAPSSATEDTSSSLFPNGGVTPAPELEENRQGAGKRQGGKRAKGAKTGRSGDVLAARAASDPLEIRIAFRKAKTEALLRHPGLAVLEREANVAPTDVEKRADLRAYYTQLYSEVCKIDPSPTMADHVKLLRAVAAQRYDPRRRTVGGDEDLVRGARGGRGKKR